MNVLKWLILRELIAECIDLTLISVVEESLSQSSRRVSADGTASLLNRRGTA